MEGAPKGVVVLNPAKPPRPREPKYTVALAKEICDATAGTPTGLERLCEQNRHWPSHVTIAHWRIEHPDFNDAFMIAQRIRAALMMDKIVDIVDDMRQDMVSVGKGRKIPNPVAVQRAKVRAEFYERIAKRLDPATWGDKVDASLSIGYLPQDEAIKYLK